MKDYREFSEVAAAVPRGGGALYPTAAAARIPAAWNGAVEVRPVSEF